MFVRVAKVLLLGRMPWTNRSWLSKSGWIQQQVCLPWWSLCWSGPCPRHPWEQRLNICMWNLDGHCSKSSELWCYFKWVDVLWWKVLEWPSSGGLWWEEILVRHLVYVLIIRLVHCSTKLMSSSLPCHCRVAFLDSWPLVGARVPGAMMALIWWVYWVADMVASWHGWSNGGMNEMGILSCKDGRLHIDKPRHFALGNLGWLLAH